MGTVHQLVLLIRYGESLLFVQKPFPHIEKIVLCFSACYEHITTLEFPIVSGVCVQ
jgi:hypothetical protein